MQFRRDWLYNAVVCYCDNIPSGEAVLALIQEAKELLRENENFGNFAQYHLLQPDHVFDKSVQLPVDLVRYHPH